MAAAEFDQQYALEQLRRARHPARRLVKQFYLNNILREVVGPTIDFGCGAGQLLAQLPPGSVGLEINPHLAEELRRNGMNVRLYDPDTDRFALRDLSRDYYQTFVIAHVLEHLPDPARVVRSLWSACRRLGIRRIVAVVPGWKGYCSDATHQTFVDLSYLTTHRLLDCEGYTVRETSHFPLNLAKLGQVLTYHELKIVYERAD